ncbi:hypothetical protein [Gemmatimonas sp.]|uniref:hypothetical protein n=1 Tax=Gemmatimonas sp. TaxID=1962908 RepID=UPI003DA2E153
MKTTTNRQLPKGMRPDAPTALRSPRIALLAAQTALLRAIGRAYEAACILEETAKQLDPTYASGAWYVGSRCIGELDEVFEVVREDMALDHLPNVVTVPSRRSRKATRPTERASRATAEWRAAIRR